MKHSDFDIFDEEPPEVSVQSERLQQINNLFADLDPSELNIAALLLKQFLPASTLDDVNVAEEVVTQLRTAQFLSADVMTGHAKMSDRIAAVRSVNVALTQLIQLQGVAYNIERMKALQQAIQNTLRAEPNGDRLLATFKANYQRMTENLN